MEVPSRATLRKALPDVLVGAMFIGFGLFFAVGALTYEVGTPFAMGPGFFPLTLGSVLVVLGLLIVGSGFAADKEGIIGPVPWRGIVLVTLAFLFFGLTVRGLGVVPSLFITTLLTAFGSERMGVVNALLIAAGLTAVSVVIFIFGLQLNLPLFGPWLDVLGL